MKKRTNRSHRSTSSTFRSWCYISGRNAKLAKDRKDARIEVVKEATNEQSKNDI